MRADACAVAWREDTDVSPADGVGTGFHLFVRCPRQMQTAN